MQVREHKLEMSYILNAATRDYVGPVYTEDGKCNYNYKVLIIVNNWEVHITTITTAESNNII